MLTENIDALNVSWWVTYENERKEFPEKLYRKLMVKYSNIYGECPPIGQGKRIKIKFL
jgi:hypothetical protein